MEPDMTKPDIDTTVHDSSGDVFPDLGVPWPTVAIKDFASDVRFGIRHTAHRRQIADVLEAITADRDRLAKERDEAKRELASTLERERTAVCDAANAIKKAVDARRWLYEGHRGSFAHDDDRFYAEFGDAIREIDEALNPLNKIAADWSNCSRGAAEVMEARRSIEADLSAATARAEKAEAERDNATREVSRLRRDGEWYQHVKRGGIYSVVGTAKLQTETPLSDMAEVTIYVSHKDGKLWARPPSEFNDGRFIGPLPRGHKTDEPTAS